MTSFEVVSARVRERYSEAELARILIREASRRLEDMVSSDVIIVGAGPAGLTAAWLLAEKGFKVVVLERGLGVGGGLRGGGMLLPAFIIEEGEAIELARRAGIRLREAGEGIYVVDPIEFSAKLTSKAIDAGALIWVGVFVEDLVVRIEGDKVSV
ncbi:MAG: FAD-dependent oxidoreductase, partial [Pyrodictiaceae archaeon]